MDDAGNGHRGARSLARLLRQKTPQSDTVKKISFASFQSFVIESNIYLPFDIFPADTRRAMLSNVQDNNHRVSKRRLDEISPFSLS